MHLPLAPTAASLRLSPGCWIVCCLWQMPCGLGPVMGVPSVITAKGCHSPARPQALHAGGALCTTLEHRYHSYLSCPFNVHKVQAACANDVASDEPLWPQLPSSYGLHGLGMSSD